MKPSPKDSLKKLPPVRWLIRSHFYAALRYWVFVIWNRWALRFSSRPPQEAFTRFYRNPHQFAALVGPALDFLKPSEAGQPLRIVVLACSTGAEPYSIASTLANERPDVEFEIFAGDINEELVAKCRTGRYTEAEIFSNELITESFVSATFDQPSATNSEKTYSVRSDISSRVTFSALDALDPKLEKITGKADILFLQNVLFNLPPEMSDRMFNNAMSLLAEKAVVFLDGMDVHQRARMTAGCGLTPLDYEIEAIHNEVWRIRKLGWPGLYWGIEPFWRYRKDTLKRYATIYFHNSTRL